MARGSSFLVWGTVLEAGSAGDKLSFFPLMELLNGHLLLRVICLKLELCVRVCVCVCVWMSTYMHNYI